MTRSAQESPVPEIGTPGSRWRGLETAYGEPTRARSWKRRLQPRGAYGALRQSSTLLKTLSREAYCPTTRGVLQVKSGSCPLPTKVARYFHPTGCRVSLHDAFGDLGSLRHDGASRAAESRCENLGKSTAKRATLLPSAGPSPGIHQKRPRALNRPNPWT